MYANQLLSITGRYREGLSWGSKQSYQGLCEVQCHSTLHDLQLVKKKKTAKRSRTLPRKMPSWRYQLLSASVKLIIERRGFLYNPLNCLVHVFVASGCQVELLECVCFKNCMCFVKSKVCTSHIVYKVVGKFLVTLTGCNTATKNLLAEICFLIPK